MKKIKVRTKVIAFDPVRFLGDDERFAGYLKAVLEANDPDLRRLALIDVARA